MGCGPCGCKTPDDHMNEVDEGPSQADVARFGCDTAVCPSCAEEVYDDSTICPSCGHAILESTSRNKAPVVGVLVAGVVIAAFLAVYVLK